MNYTYNIDDNLSCTTESISKRKDPKQMSMEELDDYINRNQKNNLNKKKDLNNLCDMNFENNNNENNNNFFLSSNLKENLSPNLPISNNHNDNEIYIRDLERKINDLQTKNDELQKNFMQLSELLEKERQQHQNEILNYRTENEQKFIKDNSKLLKELNDLKFQNSLNLTNLNILNSEKERHLEQNLINKDFYEKQIKDLTDENNELKNEIKENTKNFQNLINQQHIKLENDYNIQIKTYKDIIKKYELDKQNIIKKYENKIKELQVKLNRYERDKNILGRSLSKGKITKKSKSKEKVRKLSQKKLNLSLYSSDFNSNYSNNNLYTFQPINESFNNSFGSCVSFRQQDYTLTNINDNIFNIERNIADLKHNHNQLVEKLNNPNCNEDSSNISRNINAINDKIIDLTNKLNDLKKKQQEFLKNGFINS